MKKSLCALLILFAGWQTIQAQDVSKFKVLSDSAYQSTAEYQAANKYQKDAILFMDMVADTHPYYIKEERRAEWFAKKQTLIEQCKSIETDEAFADALIEVLGPLHDKHTDLTTIKRMQESKQKANKKDDVADVPGPIDIEHIMCRHDSNYDYQLFPKHSICYLQFNQCVNTKDYPFAKFLDDMFAKMDESGIKTLVVDAQYNNGGSSQLCDELLLHLYPLDKMKHFTTYLRFSDLMAAYNPRIAVAKNSWEDDGHKDELYQMPAPKIPADFQQPKLFEGQVVFVMGKRTFSSAGMLFTLARDNHIGTIIGTTSTFSPSHYGEILPYRLPNTGVLGSISCKFFARPDAATVDDKYMEPDVKVDLDDKDTAWKYIIDNYDKQEKNMKQRFCQSCGMPLTEDVLGTNADGSKNEDYCMYCYKDGKFLQDCTMEEMIEHCAQFVNAVNEGLEKPITKEEYIGMMKAYFPQLKRWRQTLDVNNDEAMNANPALAGVKELIAQMADKQPIAYISSVDQEGFPWTKAMLKPRKREGIKTFYFTTNTFSIRVAQYKANPKASIYFCDAKGFKGMMLRGTMEVLTDAASKEMIWHNGDEQYYPGGVTDPNYCVLKFTATDGRFYSDFYPRSFVIE